MVESKIGRNVETRSERWAIDGVFTISRGARTHAEVVTVSIMQDGKIGRGECVPYARYGESVDSVIQQIADYSTQIESSMSRNELNAQMPAGAARNAIDCALWDLEAKISGKQVATSLFPDAAPLKPVITAYTISLGTPEQMHKHALENQSRDLLKIKLGGDGDIERMKAVRSAAPNSKFILDANEAWHSDILEEYLSVAAQIKADVVEQPLPSDNDGLLAQIKRPIAVCADESLHTSKGLSALKDRYDCVNIKLDKTGGLTEALKLYELAKENDFSIMIGCMVGTSLAMAPALMLAQHAQFVDLDGPLLLKEDRKNGLVYDGSYVSPPHPDLWG